MAERIDPSQLPQRPSVCPSLVGQLLDSCCGHCGHSVVAHRLGRELEQVEYPEVVWSRVMVCSVCTATGDAP